MKTIVELYDKEPIKNVLATTVFKPERVIFVGDKDMDKHKILNYFKHKNIKVKVEFEYVISDSIEDIYQKLESIFINFPNTSFHVTGGEYLELIAVGQISKQYNIPLFYYHDKLNSFKNLLNCPEAEDVICNEKFTVNDFLVMMGASISGHGHLAIEEISEDLSKDIHIIWNLFFHNTYKWKNFVTYIQTLTGQDVKSKTSLKEVIFTNKFSVKEMLNELNEKEMINHLEIKGNKVSFSYKNEIIKKCINNIGTSLELYIYMIAKNMNYFDDVKISAIIDWNGIENESSNVQNEIDVILTKGVHPIFISCKSGKPNTRDLTELHTLVNKFGGEYAKGLIATTSNFSRFATAVYKRTFELDLNVIEKSDIEKGKIEDILKDIVS